MEGKTAIYIRVSTEDQAKDGFSIHAQHEKLTKYADANEWDIYDYYVDDGISGKNLINRPEVTRMLEDVKSKKVNNVLIYKLDRLTRSMKDLIYLIEFFESNNCTFNSQTEKIDTSNAVGRMFVKIIGIFAEFERENLAERVAFGYEQKTREGNYTNTNGVYGYDYIKGEGKLEVNKEEAKIVEKIFDLYIGGESYFKIARKFNITNIPTKRGGHWASATIKSIIGNPLYIGKVRYGVAKKNQHRAFEVDGKNVEAIISNEKWNEANRVVSTRKKYCVRRYPSPNAYYFHTIKCGLCGGTINARQQKQHGKIYITYSCNAHSRGFCEAKGFSHYKMEESFLNYLENLPKIMPTEEIMKQQNKLSKLEDQRKKNQFKIDRLDEKKKNIRQQFIDDLLDIGEYQNLIDEINEQQKIFKEELEKKGISEVDNVIYKYEDIKDIVSNIKLNWENLNNFEKMSFLEKFVNEIKVCKIEDKVVIDNVEFVGY